VYDYSDYHLMSHRHGYDSMDWGLWGLLLAALAVCGGIVLLALLAFRSAECQQTRHDG
jgi:hypothetical protein